MKEEIVELLTLPATYKTGIYKYYEDYYESKKGDLTNEHNPYAPLTAQIIYVLRSLNIFNWFYHPATNAVRKLRHFNDLSLIKKYVVACSHPEKLNNEVYSLSEQFVQDWIRRQGKGVVTMKFDDRGYPIIYNNNSAALILHITDDVIQKTDNTLHMQPHDSQKKQIVHDGCIITASGILFDLYNPDPDKIILTDIAHHLSMICRWNGATKRFYSVAEHCVRVSHKQDLSSMKLTALFHDAEEAYWGDIIKPVKNLLPQEMRDKMKALRKMIFEKFGIEPIDAGIEKADLDELHFDYENMILSDKHVPWSDTEARYQWLEAVKSAKIYSSAQQ